MTNDSKHLSPIHTLFEARMTFVSRVIDPQIFAVQWKRGFC